VGGITSITGLVWIQNVFGKELITGSAR